MEEKDKIVIQNSDGSTIEVELVTYLISEDGQKTYLVYSKGEKTGADDDEVIYITRVTKENGVMKVHEITDDNEWAEVQKLLKKIANA